MQVTFERIVVAEGSPEKLEDFLNENAFVYWIKGSNREVWEVSPNFIEKRYENHFYLLDFDGESFLLASTVPLRVPFLGNRVVGFGGKRKTVARRVKLHFLDPFRRSLKLQRSGSLGLLRVLFMLLIYAIFAWLAPYLLLIIIPVTILEFVPGRERVVLRDGNEVRVLLRDRRAVFVREFLIGAWLILIGVGITLYRAYTGKENPETAVFLATLTLALAVDEYRRFRKRLYSQQLL
ncbi:hypothetical protein [Thermococcus sp.]